MKLALWQFLFADLAQDQSAVDPAAAAGKAFGHVVFLALVAGVGILVILGLVRAFTKSNKIWIIAGSLGGLFLAWWVGMFVYGLVSGISQEVTKSREASARASAPIVGKSLPYMLERPAGWSVKRGVGEYDAVLNSEHAFVGVIAEKTNPLSSEALAQRAQQRFSGQATEVSFGNQETVTVDGRKWIRFLVRGKMRNQPFVYRYSIYSGKEGMIQLIGWSLANDWDGQSAIIDGVIRTFHFPP